MTRLTAEKPVRPYKIGHPSGEAQAHQKLPGLAQLAPLLLHSQCTSPPLLPAPPPPRHRSCSTRTISPSRADLRAEHRCSALLGTNTRSMPETFTLSPSLPRKICSSCSAMPVRRSKTQDTLLTIIQSGKLRLLMEPSSAAMSNCLIVCNPQSFSLRHLTLGQTSLQGC